VHTGGGRRGKSRPRILYWFRTPPGVRIGRSALDEDAIRLIEQHNPEVEFDWTRILKGQDAPVETRAPQQDRHGRQRREFSPRPSADRAPTPVEIPPNSPVLAEPIGMDVPSADKAPAVASPPAQGLSPVVEVPEIALLEELLADPAAESPADRAAPDETVTAAQARLGSEGLSRLRARHSEVLARISEAVTDPVRRDELKSQADRLNPDTWVTEAEVTAGLEVYESVFESLRTVVGRRRKRRRRSGQARDAASSESDEISRAQPAGGEEPDAEEPGEES
jgi:hypothetical protein